MPSTSWTNDTIKSTNWTQVTTNSTSYNQEITTAPGVDIFLLETGDYLLFEDDTSFYLE